MRHATDAPLCEVALAALDGAVRSYTAGVAPAGVCRRRAGSQAACAHVAASSFAERERVNGCHADGTARRDG
eukprot:36171-Prymnesium_polylepis.1